MYEILSNVPPSPNQNPGAAPVHLISIHISTVICTMLNVQTLSQKNKTLSQFQNLKKITALQLVHSKDLRMLMWFPLNTTNLLVYTKSLKTCVQDLSVHYTKCTSFSNRIESLRIEIYLAASPATCRSVSSKGTQGISARSTHNAPNKFNQCDTLSIRCLR